MNVCLFIHCLKRFISLHVDTFAWKLLFLFEYKIKSAIDWPLSFLVFTTFSNMNIIAADTLAEWEENNTFRDYFESKHHFL